MPTLRMNTPEEKKAIFERARRGDPAVVNYLWQRYHLRVWTHEELTALNLLVQNGIETELTLPFIELFARYDARPKYQSRRDERLGRTLSIWEAKQRRKRHKEERDGLPDDTAGSGRER